MKRKNKRPTLEQIEGDNFIGPRKEVKMFRPPVPPTARTVYPPKQPQGCVQPNPYDQMRMYAYQRISPPHPATISILQNGGNNV